MEKEKLKKLEQKAKQIRKTTIEMFGKLGFGHIGGSMSVVEVLTVLYYEHMRVDSADPHNPKRDKLVLSKGHAGPTLYSILADKGFFPKQWLDTLNRGGTRLPSHCDKNLTPGIDMSTGALGQGLSVAVGMALANRLDKIDSKIYVIIGDGESNEGQVWEGAMASAHFELNHLIAFTYFNKMQIDGYTHEIMKLEDLSAKWASFGWFTQRIDGHDISQLDSAIRLAKLEKSRPSMIILDTIKGKGAFFAEGKVINHHMSFDLETAREAIRILDSQTA